MVQRDNFPLIILNLRSSLYSYLPPCCEFVFWDWDVIFRMYIDSTFGLLSWTSTLPFLDINMVMSFSITIYRSNAMMKMQIDHQGIKLDLRETVYRDRLIRLRSRRLDVATHCFALVEVVIDNRCIRSWWNSKFVYLRARCETKLEADELLSHAERSNRGKSEPCWRRTWQH
jgi:hypothetical protein